ncbi:SnoaL-like domain-containing protein [Sinosporangium album]|uniref:SnoaL-like domain-containing protein n=1 Tax=Sinosporangium album TaxID=504805 RepID=A0A1G7YPU9_9ACTN|nr:nuclear transport factor 2 family protein [Sinosporangium album]SDG98424.1 SnoaL-like domain-containing protein [Sinosporangium album]
MTNLESQTDYALERAKIENTIAGFVLALDTRDIKGAVDRLAERVTWNYESVNGRPAAELGPDDLAARWNATLVHTDASQHFLSLPHITVNGDHASCVVHARVEIRLSNPGGSPSTSTNGTYTFGLVRAGSGWRIDAVTMTLLWNDGNARIMELAAEKGARG